MRSLIPGSVAWYVTGRFYLSTQQTLEDLGYFLHLANLPGPLFSGPIGEATAHFTFRAKPFTANTVYNGSLKLGLDSVGTFSLYYQATPSADFAHPASFAQGEEIAVFERTNVVMGQTLNRSNQKKASGVFSTNVFTAQLVASRKFKYRGQTYDLKRLLPRGITQWGTASPVPVGKAKGYTTIVPFAGSALAL